MAGTHHHAPGSPGWWWARNINQVLDGAPVEVGMSGKVGGPMMRGLPARGDEDWRRRAAAEKAGGRAPLRSSQAQARRSVL